MFEILSFTAYWIFYIWAPLHFLLGGFVMYQWKESAQEAVIHGKSSHYVISFIFILLTASSVSYIFYRLTKEYPTTSWMDKMFIHAPFFLWHGWITFSAVVNLFQAFTGLREDGPSVWIRILVILALYFLTFTANSYVEFKKNKEDITGAFVIGLGLLAIFINQHDPWINWSALVAAIISLVYPVRPYAFKLLGRESDAENTPLLSNA